MGRGCGKSQATIDLTQAAHDILAEIQPASVRAVCYPLFIRKLIPDMSKGETNKISDLIARAREDDIIPWDWVVTEGQEIEGSPGFDDPDHFARVMQHGYSRNKWKGQPVQILVVSEKGTVRGTIKPLTDEFGVQFLPVGGFMAATRAKDIADFCLAAEAECQLVLLLYVGDFDPSGMWMSEMDLLRRLAAYTQDPVLPKKVWEKMLPETAQAFLDEKGIDLRRVALVPEDIESLGPAPCFPASDKGPQYDAKGKRTSKGDTRYPWFVRTHGLVCAELDALNPNELRQRLRDAIEAEIDMEAWRRYVLTEGIEYQSYKEWAQTWPSSISGLTRKYLTPREDGDPFSDAEEQQLYVIDLDPVTEDEELQLLQLMDPDAYDDLVSDRDLEADQENRQENEGL